MHVVTGVMVCLCEKKLFEYSADECTAKDYVEGMWRMLQQPEPEDFVLATGETHPVREFVEKAFAELDVHIKSVDSTPCRFRSLQ